MGMDEASIFEYLKNIRNQKTNDTSVTKQFLEKLTEKHEWTDKQCHEFFENLLRHYIRDENDLDLMLAVSGLKDGYKEPKLTAAQRRERYLQFVMDNNLRNVTTPSGLLKQEKPLLVQIASDLKADIDDGKIGELLSVWVPGAKTCPSSVKTSPTFYSTLGNG